MQGSEEHNRGPAAKTVNHFPSSNLRPLIPIISLVSISNQILQLAVSNIHFLQFVNSRRSGTAEEGTLLRGSLSLRVRE